MEDMHFANTLGFLFSHSFSHQDFTDRHEIWHEASPISQAGFFLIFGAIPPGTAKLWLFFSFLGHCMEGYAF